MKILLIHTYYQQHGGEDAVFEQEYNLLKNGHQVEMLKFQNKKGWRGMFQFLFSIWNLSAVCKVKKYIKRFEPDVVHIHNWHFACGPLFLRSLKKMNVPVVVTLHNYRLLCPSAILLHKGKVFEDSLSCVFPWKAIKNKVYRDSNVQTFWLAFVVWFHKRIGTWQKVDKYIVLTDFAKQVFLNSKCGILNDKFVVKPNFIEQDEIQLPQKAPFFLFIGRLSEEKGIDCLLEVFKKNGLPLKIGGIGPLQELVKEVSCEYSNIKYLGRLDKIQVLEYMKKCTALIFPSIWYEGMPMTMLEAFSVATPIIASDLGAMKSIVEHGYNGMLFEVGNVDSLNCTLQSWQNLSLERKEEYSKNALQSYSELYTQGKNYTLLMDIYKSVIHE